MGPFWSSSLRPFSSFNKCFLWVDLSGSSSHCYRWTFWLLNIFWHPNDFRNQIRVSKHTSLYSLSWPCKCLRNNFVNDNKLGWIQAAINLSVNGDVNRRTFLRKPACSSNLELPSRSSRIVQSVWAEGAVAQPGAWWGGGGACFKCFGITHRLLSAIDSNTWVQLLMFLRLEVPVLGKLVIYII